TSNSPPQPPHYDTMPPLWQTRTARWRWDCYYDGKLARWHRPGAPNRAIERKRWQVLKTLCGIGAMILGVVAILVSVGLQTIWAPPAVFNATTETTQDAPLTIITDGVDIDPDEAIEYTVKGDGEFTLMYGQLRDIEAWVGDAAHHRIDGVNTD